MGKSHSNASSAGSTSQGPTSTTTASTPGADPQQQLLKLHSPVGSEPMIWPFPGDQRQQNYHRGGNAGEGGVGHEIADTIKWVCDDFPTLKQALDVNDVLKSYDVKSYESMKKLCTKYNQSIDAILQLEKGTATLLQRLQQRPSRGLLKHIIQKVYNTAVTDPEKLNQYEPFSPEVYGETSYDLVCKIIDQVDLNEEDVFIDLGSGVGQVVLQIAGLTKCKTCLGIEKAEVPSSYAVAMDTNFRKWMKWFGKKFSEYKLIKGDFLDVPNREKITGSTIVFVNNYAFGPIVDHELKERFQDLKDGARVVSSRAFCPLQFRITERTLGDIGAIIHIQELESTNGNVSWTNKPVSYYCHTIDRSKLQRYFESIKKKRKHESNASSNEGCGGGDENMGPTTRRAWSDWCSKSNKTSEDEEEDEQSLSLKRRRNGSKALKKTTRKLRLRRAKGKKKKQIKKIIGLDLLHQSTLQSTTNANHTPAPGTIDQKLTQLTTIATTGLFHHEELPPSSDTPYALQKLLELYRKQMLGIIEGMKTEEFKQQVQDQIDMEKQRRVYLLSRAEMLNNSIKKLIQDSTELLKLKLEELNIPSDGATADTLLSEARSIVIKHKEIQSRAETLQAEVDDLERRNGRLVEMRMQEIVTQAGLEGKLDESRKTAFCHKYLLAELVHTLEERSRLQRDASVYEGDVKWLEETVKEHEKKRKKMRSQREWPEIPSLEIINEKNPELLAKRILETGRLVEGQQQQQKRPGQKIPAGPASGGYPAPAIMPTAAAAAAPPRVNYLEDRLQELITNCLKEDTHTSDTHAHANANANAKMIRTITPPPAPPSQHQHTPPSNSKKPLQLSPDIASGPPSASAGNTKNALRAHLGNKHQQERNEPPSQHMHTGPNAGAKRSLSIGDVVNTAVDKCLKQGQERRASVLVAGPGMEGLGAVLQMQYGGGGAQQQQQRSGAGAPPSTQAQGGGGFVTEVVLGEKEPNSVNSVLRVVRKRVGGTAAEDQDRQPTHTPPAKKPTPSPSPVGIAAAITRVPTPGSRVHTPTPPASQQPRSQSQPPPADSPHQWQTKIQHNFDRLFCYATEARRKSTEAKQRERERESSAPGISGCSSGSGSGSSGGDGESPDSGLGKDLLDCGKRQMAGGTGSNGLGLPRTPSPSHVDEDDELVFGGGYKEWVDDEEPPPTPRLLVKQESSGSGSGQQEPPAPDANSKEPPPATAEEKQQPTTATESSVEPAPQPPPPPAAAAGTTVTAVALERPPSTASSTCSEHGPHRPSSTASSAASEAAQLHTPQHFKKRWNQTQQLEATSTSSNSSSTTATETAAAPPAPSPCASNANTPAAALEESQSSYNKFRPKGKAYIQQQNEQQQQAAAANEPLGAPQQQQQQQQHQIEVLQSSYSGHGNANANNTEQKLQPQQQHYGGGGVNVLAQSHTKPQLKNIVMNGGQPVYNKVNGSVTTAPAAAAAGIGQQQQHQQYTGSGHIAQQQQQHYGQQQLPPGTVTTHTHAHNYNQPTPPPPLPPGSGVGHYNQPPPPPPPAAQQYSHGHYNQPPPAAAGARFVQQQQQAYTSSPPQVQMPAGGVAQQQQQATYHQSYNNHSHSYMPQQQKMHPHPHAGYHQQEPPTSRYPVHPHQHQPARGYTNFGHGHSHGPQQQQQRFHYNRYRGGGQQQSQYGGCGPSGGYYGGPGGAQQRR